jgi:hypothetical protein
MRAAFRNQTILQQLKAPSPQPFVTSPEPNLSPQRPDENRTPPPRSLLLPRATMQLRYTVPSGSPSTTQRCQPRTNSELRHTSQPPPHTEGEKGSDAKRDRSLGASRLPIQSLGTMCHGHTALDLGRRYVRSVSEMA